MSPYEKMNEAAAYARAQRESGMSTEKLQAAANAPSRLTSLSSIRDLALGVGLKTRETVDGKPTTLTGQQQMAQLLNYFGGSNNPFEVLRVQRQTAIPAKSFRLQLNHYLHGVQTRRSYITRRELYSSLNKLFTM